MTEANLEQGASKTGKRKGDKVLFCLLSILACIGLFGYLKFQDSVFPSASIKFAVSKAEIMQISDRWKADLKIPGDYPITSCVFNLDEGAKNFLDFKLGTREANRLMKDQAPVFYWDISYAKPMNQETVQAQISPDGKLVAFVFYIDKDRKLPSLSRDEALSLARRFVEAQSGFKEALWDIEKEETRPQSGRVDHRFVFQHKEIDYAGAKLRIAVSFSGNLMTEYNSMVHLPDSWSQEYGKMRSRNELLQSIATIFYVILHPLAFYIAFSQWQKGNVRIRFALFAAAVLTVIFLANNYNDFPLRLASYSSEKSYQSFLIQTLSTPLLNAIMVFCLSAVLAAAGEIIYRKSFPEKIALEDSLSLKGLASEEGLKGLYLGIIWCAVSLGYQIAYYWLGRKVGYWCPIQLDNYQVLGSYLPWIGAVSLGVFASTSEEILYRVLFLGLCKPIVKNFWLANFLQAAAWGFMHSSYEQQPCYARGLELTIEGMLDGFILRRFGLLPCIVSHYLFDAFCCVTPLFKAPPSLMVSAAVPFAPVLVLLFLGLWQRGKLAAPLKNSDLPVKEPQHTAEEEEEAHIHYEPLKKGRRWQLALVIALGLSLAVFADRKIAVLGENLKPLKIERHKAIETARGKLAEKNIDLSGYQVYTTLTNGYSPHQEEFQYIFEKLGLKKTIELADKIEHTSIVGVQFRRPLDPNKYGAYLDEEGKLLGYALELSEDSPGASLDRGQAVNLARSFMLNNRSIYYPLQDDQYENQKQVHRIDHSVTFKVPTYQVAEAPLKVSIQVIGDIACNISHTWDPPDDWQWKRKLRKTKDEIADNFGYVVKAAILIMVILAVVKIFRHHRIVWKPAMKVALIWLVLGLLDTGNNLINIYESYDTAKPLQNFFLQSAIEKLGLAALQWLGVSLTLVLSLAALPAEVRKRLRACVLMLLPARQEAYTKQHRDYWLDAILLGGTFTVLSGLLSVLSKWMKVLFSHELPCSFATGALADAYNTYFPALSDLTDLLKQAVNQPLIFGAAAALLITLKLRSLKFIIPMVLTLAFMQAVYERHTVDIILKFLSLCLSFSLYYILILTAARRNILTLILYSFFSAALARLTIFLDGGKEVFASDIATVSVLILLPLTYLLYTQRVHELAKRLSRR